jgi:glycosyltransferase involved in cell wall biosynthesis
MKIGVSARSLVFDLTGIGRYVLEMCRHLAQKGHELYIYLPEKPSIELTHLPEAKVHIGNYRGAIQRILWEHIVLPHLVAKDEIDIFWGPAHRLPFFLHKDIPRVLTIHDLVWVNAGSTMKVQNWLAERLLMAPAIKSADMIVADSQSTAEALLHSFPVAKKKINVIYPGLSRYEENKSINYIDSFRTKNDISSKYVLFVGTLEPRKNLSRLLEAYSRLSSDVRDSLNMVIVGGQGWRMGDLSQLISELDIEASVKLTGYIPDSELGCLYANAYFLAMPSLYEGFGFPIIEAQAVGVPVLTSNLSSMPEVAGDAALLVDPYDVDELSAAILRLDNDNILYQCLACKARANAERFDWNKSADMLLNVFQNAIKTRR